MAIESTIIGAPEGSSPFVLPAIWSMLIRRFSGLIIRCSEPLFNIEDDSLWIAQQ